MLTTNEYDGISKKMKSKTKNKKTSGYSKKKVELPEDDKLLSSAAAKFRM